MHLLLESVIWYLVLGLLTLGWWVLADKLTFDNTIQTCGEAAMLSVLWLIAWPLFSIAVIRMMRKRHVTRRSIQEKENKRAGAFIREARRAAQSDPL